MNFQYKVRAADGTVVTGTGDAPNRARLISDLQKNGYRPLAVMPVPVKARGTAGPRARGGKKESLREMGWGKRVKEVEILLFTRDLLSAVHAGLPMVSGFHDLARQTGNPYFRRVLGEIGDQINAGNKLSEALDRHPEVFSDFYRKSVQAGEEAGRLEGVLERLTNTLEAQVELTLTVKNALRYPMIVMAFMAAAFVLITVFVIPRIATLYGRVGVELPLATRIIIGAGQFAAAYTLPLAIFFAALGVAFALYKKTPRGRAVWDAVQLRIPIFGGLIHKVAMVKFANCFQVLYASGILLPNALDISAAICGNKHIQTSIEQIASRVRAGGSLSEGFGANPHFPPLVVRMISTGEKSGSLEIMLGEVVLHYDREIRYVSKSLASMIEPILTVFFGALILILALGVFTPMWGVIKVFKGG